MCNSLYSYLVNKKKLYSKQFDFQKCHSTEHAVAQLSNQIHESFENDNYMLVVFIDLSKAFDTIDHQTLLKKVENYGIKGTNLAWLRSYLVNRKQYIFKSLMIAKAIYHILHVEYRRTAAFSILTESQIKIEGFFIDLNPRRKKRLLYCSYNAKYSQISHHLKEIGKNLDVLTSKYDNMGDFNAEPVLSLSFQISVKFTIWKT